MSDSRPPSDLTDRVARVTGGASGIGRAASIRLAEAGALVMCADIDAEGAKATAETISGSGGRAASLQLDVTNETAVEKSLQQRLDTLGGFDILCNNAGIGATDYKLTLEVNQNGVYDGLRYGTELLASRGGGAIVNTASIAGLGHRYYSLRSSSKSAYEHRTKPPQRVLAQWIASGLDPDAWRELVAHVPALSPGSASIEVQVAV